MKGQLVKKGGALYPATDEDRDKVNSLEQGEVVSFKSLDQRNARHHRKFFKLIALAHENLPHKYERNFPTPDHLREELIKRAGYWSEYTDFKGNKQYKADSISFDSMGQKKFEELYERVLDVIAKWLEFDRELFNEQVIGELGEFAY